MMNKISQVVDCLRSLTYSQAVSIWLLIISMWFVWRLYSVLHLDRKYLSHAEIKFVKCKLISVFLIGMSQFYVALTDITTNLIWLKLGLVFSLIAAHFYLLKVREYKLGQDGKPDPENPHRIMDK